MTFDLAGGVGLCPQALLVETLDDRFEMRLLPFCSTTLERLGLVDLESRLHFQNSRNLPYRTKNCLSRLLSPPPFQLTFEMIDFQRAAGLQG